MLVWNSGGFLVYQFLMKYLSQSCDTFRFIAVGALISTVVGCIIIMIKEGLDASDENSCYYDFNNITNETLFDVNRPAPSSPLDFGKG